MFRIDNSSAATVIPTPGVVGPHPGGFFTVGDSSGTDASDLPTQVAHDWLNAAQEEICYVIEQEGLTLDKDDRTQLYTAIYNMASGTGPNPGVLFAVEDDPAPTLGGDLDVNDFAFNAGASDDILFEALSGSITFNSPYFRVGTALVHRGDTNNKIIFGTDTQDYQVDGSSIFDISASGFRIGAAGARVTEIATDTTLALDDPTLLCTQHAAKSYIDALISGGSITVAYYKIWFVQSSDCIIDNTLSGWRISNGRIASHETAPNTFDSNFLMWNYLNSTLPYIPTPPFRTSGTDLMTLMVWTDTAPGSGKSYTFFTNSLSVTISNTNQFGSDTDSSWGGSGLGYHQSGSPTIPTKVTWASLFEYSP